MIEATFILFVLWRADAFDTPASELRQYRVESLYICERMAAVALQSPYAEAAWCVKQ